MEVNNRFELLASLPVDEEPVESSFIDLTSSKQIHKIDDENSTVNCWDIPDYVEKPIPCSSLLVTKSEMSPPVPKVKKSLPGKTLKSPVNGTKCKEQDEMEAPSTTDVQSQSTTCSYYPPKPYKFKQTPSNQRNETMSRFNRKMNVLPKHASSRGNSKACTHQI